MAKERNGRIVLDVELDPDRLQVALYERFNRDAPGIVGHIRRVLELQALPAFSPHAIGPFHPAVVLQQLIGRRRIKVRAGGIRLIAWMHGRGMVGAQRRGEPVARPID